MPRKGLKEYHEIKIVNFDDNIPIFLGDITGFHRIQVNLKIYENEKIS